MSGLGKFLGVLATLMLLIFGGTLLADSLRVIDVAGIFSENQRIIGIVGGAMLLLGLAVIFFAVQNVAPEQTISIQNPEGEVRITFVAIEELLRKASRSINGVKEIKPKVIGTKKGLEILNRASVEAGVSIPQVTMRINELMKSQIKGVLGIEEIGAIRTYINRIVTEEHTKEDT